MATDATGTPTTHFSLPKFATGADAPSGKGGNAQMDAIDAALYTVQTGSISTPAGIVSGEAAVWNGTTWVRSTVTKLGITSLAGYPSDGTKFLAGDGTWKSGGAGTELDYAQITASVSVPFGGSSGSPVSFITGNSVTYDGSKVKIEVFSPSSSGNSNAGGSLFVAVYKDGTMIGEVCQVQAGSIPIYGVMFDTPSAGAHTYAVKGWNTQTSQNDNFSAGAGGSGQFVPAFLRVTKA